MSEGSEGMKKGIKYNQDQSSIMLLLELNFRHNAVVLRVTLKSIMLKFSSIMYLTLFLIETGEEMKRRLWHGSKKICMTVRSDSDAP